MNTTDSAEIHIINNDINGITPSGWLIRTKSTDVIPYILVCKNIIKSGKYLTYQGIVTNLIYTGNILPSSFLLPQSTTFTNKIEEQNLKTM